MKSYQVTYEDRVVFKVYSWETKAEDHSHAAQLWLAKFPASHYAFIAVEEIQNGQENAS
jgi:hypothetical protein